MEIIEKITIKGIRYRIIRRGDIFKSQVSDGIWKVIGEFPTRRRAENCITRYSKKY